MNLMHAPRHQVNPITTVYCRKSRLSGFLRIFRFSLSSLWVSGTWILFHVSCGLLSKFFDSRLGEAEPYFSFILHFLYIKPFPPACVWKEHGDPSVFKASWCLLFAQLGIIFQRWQCDSGSRCARLTSLWKGPLDAMTTGPHVCVSFFPTARCVMKRFSNSTSHLVCHVLIKSHTRRGLKVTF